MPQMEVSRTLILIKPDAIERGLTGEIIKRFERKGFRIINLVEKSYIKFVCKSVGDQVEFRDAAVIINYSFGAAVMGF